MIGPYGDFQFTSWSRDRVSTLARTWENPGKKEAQQDLPAHPPVPAWLSHSLTYSSSQEKVKVTQLCPTLHDPMDLATRLFCPRNSPGQNTGVDSRFLLQGIFLTKGSNPSLLHCRWILYHLSHQESPRIPEWVAYPFSSGSSQPQNRTGVSCIAVDSSPAQLPEKPIILSTAQQNTPMHFLISTASQVMDTQTWTGQNLDSQFARSRGDCPFSKSQWVLLTSYSYSWSSFQAQNLSYWFQQHLNILMADEEKKSYHFKSIKGTEGYGFNANRPCPTWKEEFQSTPKWGWWHSEKSVTHSRKRQSHNQSIHDWAEPKTETVSEATETARGLPRWSSA